MYPVLTEFLSKKGHLKYSVNIAFDCNIMSKFISKNNHQFSARFSLKFDRKTSSNKIDNKTALSLNFTIKMSRKLFGFGGTEYAKPIIGRWSSWHEIIQLMV